MTDPTLTREEFEDTLRLFTAAVVENESTYSNTPLPARMLAFRESRAALVAAHDALAAERDEAIWKRESMAKHLTTVMEELRQAQANVRTATASRSDVWFWQGDGHDEPESLACPVVMEPETLREILAKGEASKKVTTQLTGLMGKLVEGISRGVDQRLVAWMELPDESREQPIAQLEMVRGALLMPDGDPESAENYTRAIEALEALGGKP